MYLLRNLIGPVDLITSQDARNYYCTIWCQFIIYKWGRDLSSHHNPQKVFDEAEWGLHYGLYWRRNPLRVWALLCYVVSNPPLQRDPVGLSLIRALSRVSPNLLSNTIVDLGTRNSDPNNIRWIVVSDISTCWPLTLICINWGWVRGFFPLGREMTTVVVYDANNCRTMAGEYFPSSPATTRVYI